LAGGEALLRRVSFRTFLDGSIDSRDERLQSGVRDGNVYTIGYINIPYRLTRALQLKFESVMCFTTLFVVDDDKQAAAKEEYQRTRKEPPSSAPKLLRSPIMLDVVEETDEKSDPDCEHLKKKLKEELHATNTTSCQGPPNDLSLSCKPATRGDRTSGAPLAPSCRMDLSSGVPPSGSAALGGDSRRCDHTPA
jgi:hypothetical protein